jgi:hypothetical protein
MARIIVTADPQDARRTQSLDTGAPVLMDERVSSVHLSDDHASAQLIERLAWAVTDAEDAQQPASS